MGKVSRADYAETAPWSGITGKPDSFGASDIGQLTGIGYADGQVPVYSLAAGRFRPGSRNPAPAPTPPTPTPGVPTRITVTWDVPTLHALQTATEDFPFAGVFPGRPVSVGAPMDDSELYINFCAYVIDVGLVRIAVQNLGLADLDLPESQWQLQINGDS